MSTETTHKAESVEKRLRERNQRKIYPDDYFIESIRQSQSDLERSLAFLLKALEEPKLLYTDTKDEWISNRGMLFKALEYMAKGEKRNNLHDFQAFIADKLDRYLKEWAKNKGITEDVKVEVRNPLTYPSIFAVYYEDQEIIQFNIFEKWYGIRESLTTTEEEILSSGDTVMKTHEENIQSFVKRRAEYEGLSKKPWGMVKTPADVYILLFKRKKVIEGLQKQLENFDKRIEHESKLLQQTKDSIPHQVERSKRKITGMDSIVPFFEELDYSLEMNQYKLY